MSDRTPGPWEVVGDATVYGPRFSIVDEKEGIGRFEVADCKGYKKERDANARLISAAPDLLKALEGLVSDWERVTGRRIPDDHEAKAAIAKAKGGAK